MRNLEATRYVSLPPSPLLAGAGSCFSVDVDEGVWVASAAGLCRISPDLEVSLEVPLVEGGHVSPDDDVIGVECVSGESVCLATRNGDILLYNIQTKHVEGVGGVEGGLLGMTWSPDQELAVFSTGTGSLLLMTRQLDPSGDTDSDLVPVTEVPMCPTEFGRAEPVTVGWGKKATQFHGSAGKQSALEKPLQDTGSAHPWDDLRPRVSWPEEGEYFACSCIDPASGSRRIRVWTREGELFSTSEATAGLEHSLHWRPSGSLIASSQSLPHTHQVMFFEKNGLRHGEFPIPPHPSWQDGKCVVRELGWNCDSTVLSLWLEERKTDLTAAATSDSLPPPRHSSIQLWVRGNYHWYLKQELFSPLTPDSAPSASLQVVQWDPVVPLRLHLLTSDGCYVCCDWRWCVNKSSCLTRDNFCDVAVIDGDNLFLTPFRHLSTPPPMRTHTLSLPSPILTVSHAPPPHVNDFLVVTATAEVVVFSYSHVDREQKTFFPLPSPKLIGSSRLLVMSSLIRQLCWRGAGSLVGVVWDAAAGRDSVVEWELRVDWEGGKVEVGQSRSSPVPTPHTSLISLSSHPHSGTTVAQTTDGTLFRYSPNEGLLPWKLPSGLPIKFPEGPCDQITVAQFHDIQHVVGLNEFRCTLYVDDCKVATGVTTFDLHNEFLIYTTDSHECHFLRTFTPPAVANSDPSDKPNLVDEGKRKVERGSKIVVVVPHDSKLVLQMPRGNLETIHPRPLVLSGVRRHLDNHRYGDAFLAMRKNRINLNLIYDHNPQEFLKNVRKFVEQLESVSHINLFLTELREEDTTETMYPLPPGLVGADEGREMREREKEREEKREKKVDTVCEAVRQVLMELDENRYLLSIITAHVKKSEPELETVLLRIRHLSQQEEEEEEEEGVGGSGETESSQEGVKRGGHDGKRVSAEEALKYVLFLVDVNHLYDVALGTYDFQLVLMVAEKSQKDPKEYLPFLNELRRLPGSYQKYKIDLHLRRYHKALQHISQCGPEKFEECMGLIKEHSLYMQALEIFPNRSSPEYKTIAQCYGEHLSEKKDHKSAAIVFYRCGCLMESLENFEKAGDWQMTFALSNQLGHDRGQRSKLARKMAGSLKSQRKYSAAATVLLQYAEDVEEAMVTLLEGGLWTEALRIAYRHSRRDLIETHIRPQLLESHQQHMSLLPSLTSDLNRHSHRLQLVRDLKRKRQEAILEGTYAGDERDTDLFSDTSSVTGRSATTSLASSKMTGKSRKNRRKASHKKWSLREGSSREDLALMEAITDLCTTVDSLQDEIPSLVQMLLLYDHTQEAKQLHSLFTDLLESAKLAVEKTWPKQATPTTQVVPVTGPHATVNSMLASMATTREQLTTGEEVVEFPRPKLRDMTRISLLL